MVLSTGMATMLEIERAVAYLNNLGADFALLHCVSTYPAPFEWLNLRFIESLKRFGVPVGYSGHERGIAIPLVALALGASLIEKHLTLDRTLPGPDHPASLEPGGFQRLVRDIRNAETALGGYDKHLSAMEILNRQVLRKSIVAAQDLPAGTVVTREMTRIIGPGKGLSPQRLDELLGVTLHRDVKAGEFFAEEDLKPQPAEDIASSGLQRPWGLKARFHDLPEILALKPRIVELHFSEDDVDYGFRPPAQPHRQQLFIHAPEFAQKRLLDLASVDDERREASIALIQRTIDKAVELQPHFTGPVSVVIHVGGMSMDEPVRNVEPLLERALDSFRRLDARGVTLLPENLPPRPWYLGGQWFQNTFIHAEQMVDFCKELGLGMALDISHAQLYCTAYNKDLAHFVKTCLPHARHLHLADANGIDSEGLQIGEGVVEWEAILELLARADFTWVPEIWSGHLHRGAGFIQAINRLAKYGRL
jgi:N-acetylneuraminate synthase